MPEAWWWQAVLPVSPQVHLTIIVKVNFVTRNLMARICNEESHVQVNVESVPKL